MLDQYEDKWARNIIIGLIASGGLLGFLGLTLPYLIIYNYLGTEETAILDGFRLSYIESILQAIGNLITITTSVALFYYRRAIPQNLEKARKKFERLVFFIVSSLICTVLGLVLTIYDIIDALISILDSNSGETLELGIGFYFSVIGPLLVIIGVYNLVKLRKRLFLPS